MALILLEDSRQKEGKHKNIYLYCKRNGIRIVRKKLDCCDYMLSEDGENPIGMIGVDTKENMLEICKDIMTNDHRRFRNQCIRAQEAGIRLIILVEEEPPYGKVDLWDVPKYQMSNDYHRFGDPVTRVHPRALRKAMQTMTEKYGVQFRFCDRRHSPKNLIKYLKGEYK